DANRLEAALAARFFAAQLRDETFPRQELFSGAGEDSLRGLFLLKLREKLEAEGDPRAQERIRRAARYGLAALDGREAWRP
ncbi:MAG: DNA repair exonuclease, partial [bacterium]